MDELIQKLSENNLIDENGNIILKQYENGSVQAVSIDTFKTFFSDKSMTYDNLIGSHVFIWNGENLTKIADELGYKIYFDKWKELNII